MPFDEDELREIPRASDVIIPEVTEPKYPGFSEFSQKKKVDLLSTEIAFKETSLEVVLMDLCISMEEYRKLAVTTDLLEQVSSKSKSRLIPYMPEVWDRLGQDAVDGDPAKMKMLLQTTKELDIEGALHNVNLNHMDNTQLKKELEHLQLELSELIEDEGEEESQ